MNFMAVYPHWVSEDFKLLKNAAAYRDMVPVALGVLGRMPAPVIQVCGPVSTGGRGSFEKNFEAFDEAIAFLQREGKNVFDQRPFQEHIVRIERPVYGEGSSMALLEELYLPLFESRLIHEFHFLPGWESSRGATWEHEQAKRLDIKIFYLPGFG